VCVGVPGSELTSGLIMSPIPRKILLSMRSDRVFAEKETLFDAKLIGEDIAA
jgi:hypothetical protein